MTEPNAQLRQARERIESPNVAGEVLSRQELADMVNAWIYEHLKRKACLSANYVGKMERGVLRWPNDDYRKGLRAVLGVKTDGDLGFRRPHRVPVVTTVTDVDRKEFLRTAFGAAAAVASHSFVELATPSEPTRIPAVISAADIKAVRNIAQVFSTWDHTYGGGLAREAVNSQLRYSVELLGVRCPARLQSDLYSAVGFLGHASAFMAFDAYAHEDAKRMFRLALVCAEKSGDWHLRAKVLSSMARQAIWCGDPDTGLTLVELALVRADRLTPAERAMLLAARARALAKLRRTQETLSTIGMADQEFSRLRADEEAPWMRYYDTAQHAGDTGHALFDLAIHGQFVSEASNRLSAAIAGHSDTYVRSRAISGTKLASLTMAVGDTEQATVIGMRALRDAGTVRSRRAADDLRELHKFAAPHERITEVSELRHYITDLVSGS
ncbi:hypothetical protein ABZU75_25760 [Streptosporangium sp. NPDC005286]|uniref:helix-turn-helix domain-containing protein n=1 Tax=Streptosporangium sp. NPDC005286 TaxID=3154463 RepID=UPI00339F6DE0